MVHRMEDWFYNILWYETINRESRSEKVYDNGDFVPAWVKHERAVLLRAVNNARSARGLGPVTEDDIRRGEHVGDPNYGRRLARHCADLVSSD